MSTSPTTFRPSTSRFISLLSVISPFNRIQNPLHGIPRDVLMKQVESFTKEKGLEDKVDLFKKGALLAQSPKDFESFAELTEDDKEVIRRETTRNYSFNELR